MTDRIDTATTRRRFVHGSTAAAASTFFIGRARGAAPDFVMRVAAQAQAGSPVAVQLQGLKRRIQERSGGHIRVRLHLGGSLGDDLDTAGATRRGELECYVGGFGALASVAPGVDVLELPYLFPSERQAEKILDDVIRDDLDALLSSRGLKLLFFTEEGYRSIGSTFAIAGPPDLVGRDMRAQQSDVHINTWKAFKASPVPIAVIDVLPGLQTGVVDGFDATPLQTFSASWHQTIRHFTLTRHAYQAGAVVVSRNFWESLPADLQSVVMGDPADLAKRARQSTRALAPMLEQNFVDAGITLDKLDDGQRAAFAAKAPEVHDKFRAAATAEGKALLDKIKAAL